MSTTVKYVSTTVVFLLVLQWSQCLPKSNHSDELGSQSEICKRIKDCGISQCCRVGMERYSIPVCSSLGQDGDSCKPGNKPENFNLSYPNGPAIHTTGTYTLLCPCDLGLYCDHESASCKRERHPKNNDDKYADLSAFTP
ncbi:unnamed protein product [Allacma fusca]|uniref:Prokineticin domain-containing protein n=1 Tax=Allacma fusca TaxID=39272 RepID=A0A8J2JZT7_9HEXA|nr:unnamed protein product [Allacma fusca]